MKRLDRAPETYGSITPPWHADGWDRAAHYEQNGCFFDVHGFEIVRGTPGPIAARAAVDTPPETDEMSLSVLLDTAHSMTFPKLRKAAGKLLGDNMPTGKAGIIEALLNLDAARPGRPATDVSPGKPWAPSPAPPKSTVAQNGVDLAAWGRGQKDYLFAEVAKGIRQMHTRQITERRDAVDFLIEIGAITAAEARTDV